MWLLKMFEKIVFVKIVSWYKYTFDGVMNCKTSFLFIAIQIIVEEKVYSVFGICVIEILQM